MDGLNVAWSLRGEELVPEYTHWCAGYEIAKNESNQINFRIWGCLRQGYWVLAAVERPVFV